MPNPRGHRRYRDARAAFIAQAQPICCLCEGWIDKALPGTHPAGPTIEHLLPIRQIKAMRLSPAQTLALALDTSRWALAHARCQQQQGARVTSAGNAARRHGRKNRGPSRVW